MVDVTDYKLYKECQNCMSLNETKRKSCCFCGLLMVNNVDDDSKRVRF